MSEGEIEDGGPAFPQSVAVGGAEGQWASYDFVDGSGMTLRDYFAAKALASFSANSEAVRYLANDREKLAVHCYGLADAMLKARQA
jgi:hypothetical protein